MKNFKRITAILLCMLMLIPALPLTSFAAYENTHVNTGNQIEDLIAVATTQIGYTEGNTVSAGTAGNTGGSGNYTKYGAWYGINPGAWCAMFVSWCANQAGISSSIIYKHASCDLGMQWFQNNGVWKWSPACGGSYVPKRGDIIYFRTNTAQVTDSTHVGIVYSSDSSYVYTIEGNASNKCQKKSYSLSSAYILGYGTPNYTSGTGYVTGQYQVTASSLNMRDYATTDGSTVLQALPNGAVVDITLVYGNWGYCTYNGISGWIHLGYTVYLGESSSTVTTYTLTFDPGDGTLATGSSSYQIAYGQTYSSVIGDMPTATRNGYSFDGWYCADYGYTLNMSDSFGATENVTFTAVWTPVYGVYEVTAYNLNMRAGAGSSYDVVQVLANGDQVTVTAIDGKWGYCQFNGLYGWVSLNYCVYVGEAFNGYVLTFNPNGGTMPEGYSTTYTFQADEKFVDVIGGYPVPVKEGYEFAGWRRSDYSPDFWVDGWGTQPYTFGYNVTLNAEYTTHTCSYTQSGSTPATCTEPGVTTYSCTCGESYTEETAALGHSYTTTTTAATCTAAGKTVKSCSRCGESTTTTIPATGHSYTATTTDATCTVAGKTIYTCSKCGDSYTETGSALGHSYTSKVTAPTCTAKGYTTYTCSRCGNSYTDNETAALGHTWGAWVETKAPTTTATGVETRTCSVCGATETQEIPKLEEDIPATDTPTFVGADNYTVTLSGITDVKEIRFAPGHWTTGTEVKAAEGTLTLSASLVAANTDANGIFKYDVAYATEYTFWVRMNDGTGYFVYADTSDITTYLVSDGLRLTVTDMRPASEIKDMWIAQGTWTTYSEIKNNVASTAKYQATATKLANYFATNDFTYTCLAPGAHTVLVRYNDGTVEALHTTLTVDVPVFDVNGLQVTVSNIPGVKIIRTAYGEYANVTEIKAASGVRNFNNKTAIKDAETYMIQYRDAGVVTMIVEYTTGYKHVEHITITPKQSTMTQSGDTVVFGNLDGLVMVRYAKGTYTTSAQIKAAAGSVALKTDAVVDGTITVSNLASGTYTFCVQYDDESYNYYTIQLHKT